MPIFMKYEGIEGSVTGKYKGWIELISCQLGHFRAQGSEVVVTKVQDATSTALFSEALQGTGKKVTIDLVARVDAPYMSIELENTLISTYTNSGRGDKPMETFTLNPTKISYSSKPTAASKDPKHTSVMWDLATE